MFQTKFVGHNEIYVFATYEYLNKYKFFYKNCEVQFEL
jgi:hypothetical protein